MLRSTKKTRTTGYKTPFRHEFHQLHPLKHEYKIAGAMVNPIMQAEICGFEIAVCQTLLATSLLSPLFTLSSSFSTLFGSSRPIPANSLFSIFFRGRSACEHLFSNLIPAPGGSHSPFDFAQGPVSVYPSLLCLQFFSPTVLLVFPVLPKKLPAQHAGCNFTYLPGQENKPVGIHLEF